MNIHYALYDKANDTGGAHYWIWFEPPLTYDLLDRFYGNFAVNNIPDLSKVDLAKFPFSGGIVHIADTDSTQKNGWIVLYRSFYGGARDRGRHGTVILTAWIRTNETFEGLLPIFNNGTFKFVEQHSKDFPVPAPDALTEKTGENLPEKWQKGLAKFAPYITSRFDSHLRITDNPTGLNYEQSSAFAKDRAGWEAAHIDKETALEGQVNALTANVTSLQSSLDSTQQRLNETSKSLRTYIEQNQKLRNDSFGYMIKHILITVIVAFFMLFIVSSVSPNWSVNIVKNINPFSSSDAKPTLEQQITEVEKQITEVDEKLKNFDAKSEKEKLEKEKTELETKKRTLDERQQKEQEKQKKKGA
jgi:Skp family chaperone for outer membrane proteins